MTYVLISRGTAVTLTARITAALYAAYAGL